MADSPFTAAERTIVDWFEANGFEVIEEAGEWFLDDEMIRFSITELACAVAGRLTVQ